jgi:tRNA modification GTPase
VVTKASQDLYLCFMNKLAGWDDTIVAIATPSGSGAIAVIRLSGKLSFAIINELFPSKDLLIQASHTLHVGYLREDGRDLDEVVVSLFKGPASYTGEDVIEISCHGSEQVQQTILSACIRKGARLARAGEFTQRSFLNGKMDLAQAEAVGELIASHTEAARKTALHKMRGGFSRELKEMREQLIQFSALIELELDFATEDVEFADRTALIQLIKNITETANRLADSFRLGNVIKHGISIAIIGKPNAGKSTLLNQLLNENRAIVSEVAGTTRDTIEEVININGVLFRLIDTAGIRAHTEDNIEKIGIERSLEKMYAADLVLYLFDLHVETSAALEEQIRLMEASAVKYLLVANKADEGGTENQYQGYDEIHFISAKENKGLEVLKAEIFRNTVGDELQADTTIVTNALHYEALQEMLRSLHAVSIGLAENIPGDLLAADIRQCLFHIGTITGEVSNEDRLDYIFSKFCIGK